MNTLQIFNGENILFQKLPELVNRCLVAPDPIVLHYIINPTIPAPERPMAWDVEVKTEDVALKGKMQVVVQPNKESQQNLAKLDDEVRLPDDRADSLTELNTQIATLAQSLHNSHLKRTFLQSFARDPAQFIQTWLESQSRDLETVLGSGPTDGLTIRQEELKRSEFFRLPWVEEVIPFFFRIYDKYD
jgi:SWI/SNF-related matrix-associated actin-dependent regulator of chromatin subfamily D